MRRENELDKDPLPLPSALSQLYEEKRTVTVAVTVTASIARRIDEAARKEGRSRSHWCARILSAALDQGDDERLAGMSDDHGV
jgi:hypothetical protein